jgi:ubiquitin carboxyl-terminal hydrolase 15
MKQTVHFLVNFMHSCNIIFCLSFPFRHSSGDNVTLPVKEFEAPLLTALPEMVNGLTLWSLYRKLLNPYLLCKEVASPNDSTGSNDNSTDLMDTTPSDSDSSFRNSQLEDDPESSHCSASECEIMEEPNELYAGTCDSNKDVHVEEFEFYLKNEWGDGQQKIEISELDLLKTEQSRLQVNVHWKRNALRKYDTSMLNNLPEIQKFEPVPKGTEDSVALPDCLEAFLKEEPLGPDDMW